MNEDKKRDERIETSFRRVGRKYLEKMRNLKIKRKKRSL